MEKYRAACPHTKKAWKRYDQSLKNFSGNEIQKCNGRTQERTENESKNHFWNKDEIRKNTGLTNHKR